MFASPLWYIAFGCSSMEQEPSQAKEMKMGKPASYSLEVPTTSLNITLQTSDPFFIPTGNQFLEFLLQICMEGKQLKANCLSVSGEHSVNVSKAHQNSGEMPGSQAPSY